MTSNTKRWKRKDSVAKAWDAELLKRIDELNQGKVKPVSLKEARRRLAEAIG